MACCGNKRQRLAQAQAQTTSEMTRGAGSAGSDRRHIYRETARIQYTGQTGMTVIGPFSNRRYRFNQPGEILEIDHRDAPSLAAVPNLKWLR